MRETTTKDAVLAYLAAHRQAPVSGEKIAERLHITRNSVWKAVCRLREEGNEIASTPNRGYQLLRESDALSAARIRDRCNASLGDPIYCYAKLASTNTTARELAGQGARHGTAVLADAQTGGRGRMGRGFFSPPGCGLYMTVLLRPKLPPEQVPFLTSCAAVAVARAIERVAPVEVGVKWVNDLFIGQKKVCGILCEAGVGLESGTVDFVVIGFGVNVRAAALPAELLPIVTSIETETGLVVSRNDLAACALEELETAIAQLPDGGFLPELRRRSIVLGRPVQVLCGGESYPAVAEAIDDAGHLIVRTEQGRRTLFSDEVRVRFQEEAK